MHVGVGGRAAVVLGRRAGYVLAEGEGARGYTPWLLGGEGGGAKRERRLAGLGGWYKALAIYSSRRRCGVEGVLVVFAAGEDGLEWSRTVRRVALVPPCCWEGASSVAACGKAASAAPLPGHGHHCMRLTHTHSKRPPAVLASSPRALP